MGCNAAFVFYWLFKELDNKDFFMDFPEPESQAGASLDEERLDEKKAGVYTVKI